MDRLTERNKRGEIFAMPDLYAIPSTTLSEVLNRLAAYEDTGLTPEEISAMKSEYSETYQAHLNQLLDIKDRRIEALEAISTNQEKDEAK